MRLKTFLLLFVGGAALAGCSSAKKSDSAPVSVSNSTAFAPKPGAVKPSSPKKETAKALVDSVTGNAGEARQKARDLLAESETLRLNKDYTGAMDKRLEMLELRGYSKTIIGQLTAYAIQQLAIDHMARLASQFDATNARSYARKLEATDAKMPSYVDLLNIAKAEDLQDLDRYAGKPGEWNKLMQSMGFSAADTQKMLAMTPAQVKADITKFYDARIAEAAKPYSTKPAEVVTDPYAQKVTQTISMLRYIWTKKKLDRVFAIAGLDRKADFQERHPRVGALPADPFGSGPLKEKDGMVYSVGPDGVDDGNPIIEAPSVGPSSKGDVYMPLFSPRNHNAPAFN